VAAQRLAAAPPGAIEDAVAAMTPEQRATARRVFNVPTEAMEVADWNDLSIDPPTHTRHLPNDRRDALRALLQTGRPHDVQVAAWDDMLDDAVNLTVLSRAQEPDGESSVIPDVPDEEWQGAWINLIALARDVCAFHPSHRWRFVTLIGAAPNELVLSWIQETCERAGIIPAGLWDSAFDDQQFSAEIMEAIDQQRESIGAAGGWVY
jgi:hypothetical protein